MSASVLESLKIKAEDAAEKSEAEWQSIVERVASDEATEAEVAKVLKSTGKTLETLETAVARLHEIKRLEAQIALYPARVAEHQRAHLAAMAMGKSQRTKLLKDFDEQKLHRDTTAYMAAREVEKSRNAAIALERLLQRPVNLPSLEPDVAERQVAQGEVTEHDDVAPVVAESETRGVTPLAG
jgi:hypothetical protein